MAVHIVLQEKGLEVCQSVQKNAEKCLCMHFSVCFNFWVQLHSEDIPVAAPTLVETTQNLLAHAEVLEDVVEDFVGGDLSLSGYFC